MILRAATKILLCAVLVQVATGNALMAVSHAQELRNANVISNQPLGRADDLLPQLLTPELQLPMSARDHAVLGGLNKITARVSTIEIPINQEVSFGTLSITVRTCAKRPPTETPETTAFLEITDATMPDGEGDFTGWMFASSPAISALEHPVYDVWVLDCNIVSGEASAAN